MKSYSVQALSAQGVVEQFDLAAADAADAAEQARARGVAVLHVRPCLSWRLWQARAQRVPVALLTQELLALLQSGMPLLEALEALSDKERRVEARSVLRNLCERLRAGLSFSDALAAEPTVFSPLYVATVRASERTGGLHEALSRYLGYDAQLDELKRKIITSALYPVLLLIVGGAVAGFLLGYVVPRFSAIYDDLGRELPWLSRVLLEWGRLIQAHGVFMLAAAGVALWMFAARIARQGLAAPLAWLRLMPAFARRIRIYQLARFYRTAGMLLCGGVPLVTAVQLVGDVLPADLRPRIALAMQAIERGLPASQALEAADLATPIALRMLRVGERTGELGVMMDRIAAFHDAETARWIEWFSRLFEPVLMALIGGVIGVIVLLLYLPVFELAGNLQ